MWEVHDVRGIIFSILAVSDAAPIIARRSENKWKGKENTTWYGWFQHGKGEYLYEIQNISEKLSWFSGEHRRQNSTWTFSRKSAFLQNFRSFREKEKFRIRGADPKKVMNHKQQPSANPFSRYTRTLFLSHTLAHERGARRIILESPDTVFPLVFKNSYVCRYERTRCEKHLQISNFPFFRPSLSGNWDVVGVTPKQLVGVVATFPSQRFPSSRLSWQKLSRKKLTNHFCMYAADKSSCLP